MSTQLKKGFTLIELMVVIVIIGILAAIAIPKLFGMSAKAKASEVGPAAGTWSKLQQAYVLEMTSAGSFKAIGYTPPGNPQAADGGGETNNFVYSPETLTAISEGNGWSGNIAGWKATNTKVLGDCTVGADGVWKASVSVLNGQIDRPDAVNANGACGVLTPSFKELR